MKEIHLAKFIEQKFEFDVAILLTNRAKGLLENSEGSNCRVYLL